MHRLQTKIFDAHDFTPPEEIEHNKNDFKSSRDQETAKIPIDMSKVYSIMT